MTQTQHTKGYGFRPWATHRVGQRRRPPTVQAWLRGAMLVSGVVFFLAFGAIVHVVYQRYLVDNVQRTLLLTAQSVAEQWINPGPPTTARFVVLSRRQTTLVTGAGTLPIRYVLVGLNRQVRYDSAQPGARGETIPEWLLQAGLSRPDGLIQLKAPTIHRRVLAAWVNVAHPRAIVAVTLDSEAVDTAIAERTVGLALFMAMFGMLIVGGVFRFVGRRLVRDSQLLLNIREAQGAYQVVSEVATVEAATIARRWADTLSALERARDTDLLTGAGNRHQLEAYCTSYEALPDPPPMVMVLADLDKFKWVNDTFGHLAGDQVLKDFVQSWRRVFRDGDVLVRLGGDEFAGLFVGTSWSDELFIRVKHVLVDTPWTTHPINLTMGAVELPREALEFQAAYHIADTRLYAGKERGGGGIMCPSGWKKWDAAPPPSL